MTESTESRRKWRHLVGNRYVAVFGDFWGNERDGFELVWSRLGPIRTERRTAVSDGFRAQGSDDFCIAVIHPNRKQVMAVLWMDEDKDEEQSVLDELTELVCG